jgi:hypothetical protein
MIINAEVSSKGTIYTSRNGKVINESELLQLIKKNQRGRLANLKALLISLLFSISPKIFFNTGIGWVLFIFISLYILFSYYFAKKKLRINYSLDDESSEHFSKFTNAFYSLNKAEKCWEKIIVKTQSKEDKRYQAGASTIVNRVEISPKIKKKSIIQSNLELPYVKLTDVDVLFLPDLILINEDKEIYLDHYGNMQVDKTTTRFIEDEKCPKDADVIGTTWAKVNNSGEPDKRFKDNYEIPICKYGIVIVKLPNVFIHFMISNTKIANEFSQDLQKYANSVVDEISKIKSAVPIDHKIKSTGLSPETLVNMGVCAGLVSAIDGVIDDSEMALIVKFLDTYDKKKYLTQKVRESIGRKLWEIQKILGITAVTDDEHDIEEGDIERAIEIITEANIEKNEFREEMDKYMSSFGKEEKVLLLDLIKKVIEIDNVVTKSEMVIQDFFINNL